MNRSFLFRGQAVFARGPLGGAAVTLATAGMLMFAPVLLAQAPAAQSSDTTAATATAGTTVQAGKTKESKADKKADKKAGKDDKVIQSKDTKNQLRKEKKVTKKDPLKGLDKNSPDKELYDKSLAAIKSGHFDIARLDLQVLLNTYPDSQYQMQAKLAMADSWFKEGGTTALDQAEAEYKDFITFFPNAPEAAEAQMRVGDIYYREMDKPDRDDAKALGAQREYRTMLQQFPDAPKELIVQATQRLRDVQEMLATREAEEGDFYAGHENRAAAIAHFQTVVDTFPLFSRMDETLIALGDQYEAQARYVHSLNFGEGPKSILEKEYHDAAAAAYTRVVLEHSASAHVEDAKDRLAEMNRPIPTPTQDQAQFSNLLETSRHAYGMSDRAALLFMHKPDVVQAARVGAPTLTDPKPISAPDIVTQFRDQMNAAVKGVAIPVNMGSTVVASAPVTDASAAPAPGDVSAPAGPLKLEDVPTATPVNGSTTIGSSTTVVNTPRNGSGTGVGLTIVTPKDSDTDTTAMPAKPAGTVPGLGGVGPTDNKTLPATEAAEAPPTDQVNEAHPSGSPTVTQPNANGKKPKAPVDSSNESSSKKKPKKGIGKLNPF